MDGDQEKDQRAQLLKLCHEYGQVYLSVPLAVDFED
jgi:hypothetical protein